MKKTQNRQFREGLGLDTRFTTS